MDLSPVLVDVGASGKSPKIWKPIASLSTYVGFDPDYSGQPPVPEGRFRRIEILREACVAEATQADVGLYVTKAPYCSSTLAPDVKALSHFLFSDLFSVEETVRVPAISLAAVLERLRLDGVDWLKTDSQGTDLRIFLSLPTQIRNHVMAIDCEPGLIDAYVGEDLFAQTHSQLTLEGFWLSDLSLRGAVRMKTKNGRDLEERGIVRKGLLERTIKKSPGWVEARYLRSLDWLEAAGGSKRDYVFLSTFAVMDGQLGFALDVSREYGRRFGRDDIAAALEDVALRRIARTALGGLIGALAARAKSRSR